MNQIVTEYNEKIIDEDAEKFYYLIALCINQKLNPAKDKIFLYAPQWNSSNVGDTILCEINGKRFVALKKSVPEPKMRRALLISKIKKELGFPTYAVVSVPNLTLRKKGLRKKTNCKILEGWENVPILTIDFGHYKLSKKLLNLTQNEIKEIHSFCEDYGRLAAFNYLFGVSDRNSSNFVFFLDSQTLQSVDDEAWPFHPKGDEIGGFTIIDRTRFNIQKLIRGPQRKKYVESLRRGFLEGWKVISKHYSSLKSLNRKEKELFEKRFAHNPDKLATEIFRDSEGETLRWWKKDENWWDTTEGKKFLIQNGLKLK